ncbi:MAG: hypothetical protein EB127_22410, partial [Alphaproteobacteria bacterium]|nr:hypothetical protein [Alphaproteobacteria bacterium]
MEGVGRNPTKQKKIEAILQTVEGSKSYSNVEGKIRSGTYRRSRITKNRNRASLQKTKLRLSKKLERGKSKQEHGDKAKIEKIGTLLSIMEDETNVENANNAGAEGNNANNSNNNSNNDNDVDDRNGDNISSSGPLPPAPVIAAVSEEESLKIKTIGESVNQEGNNHRAGFKMEKDCSELFDPCTREPIENSDINILEKRVREIKKQRLLNISQATVLPDDIKNRLDLLLFLLNRDEKPNEKLLEYNNNGQLYESYWDIVFTLGLIDTFPITTDFYMFNGKIETLINIDGEGFSNSPLAYLQSKKVNEGSKSGASDITFVYKKNKTDLDIDICSSDPTIKVVENCKKFHTFSKATTKETPQFFFCSSKYFNRDASKGVDKFDIQNIYTAAKSLDQEYDRKIILLVKDKGAVEEKLRK